MSGPHIQRDALLIFGLRVNHAHAGAAVIGGVDASGEAGALGRQSASWVVTSFGGSAPPDPKVLHDFCLVVVYNFCLAVVYINHPAVPLWPIRSR